MKKKNKELFCLYKILTEDASQCNPIPPHMIYFKAIEKYNVDMSFVSIENGLKEFADGLIDYTLFGNEKDGYYLQSKADNIIIQGKDRLDDYEIEEAIKSMQNSDYAFKNRIIDKLINQANENYRHRLMDLCVKSNK